MSIGMRLRVGMGELLIDVISCHGKGTWYHASHLPPLDRLFVSLRLCTGPGTTVLYRSRYAQSRAEATTPSASCWNRYDRCKKRVADEADLRPTPTPSR